MKSSNAVKVEDLSTTATELAEGEDARKIDAKSICLGGREKHTSTLPPNSHVDGKREQRKKRLFGKCSRSLRNDDSQVFYTLGKH